MVLLKRNKLRVKKRKINKGKWYKKKIYHFFDAVYSEQQVDVFNFLLFCHAKINNCVFCVYFRASFHLKNKMILGLF